MKNNPTEAQLLYAALPILQGLLASGHYTEPKGENPRDEPVVHRIDNGKEWKGGDDGIQLYAKRNSACAVIDAVDLADELLRQVKIEVEVNSTP